MHWIKLYTEILNDPKMGRMPDRLWRRCIEMFLLAGKEEADGRLPSVEDIAWYLRVDAEALERDMEQLERLGILSRDANGWYVTHFAERQAPSPGAARVRRYRQRKRAEEQAQDMHDDGNCDTDDVSADDGNVTDGVTCNVTRNVTCNDDCNADCNASVTIDTDTDTELDTEAEAEAEAEINNNAAAADKIGLADAQKLLEPVIGLYPSSIADEVQDYVNRLNALNIGSWFELAVREAAAHNARNWAYIRAVLERSLADKLPPGFRQEQPRAGPDADYSAFLRTDAVELPRSNADISLELENRRDELQSVGLWHLLQGADVRGFSQDGMLRVVPPAPQRAWFKRKPMLLERARAVGVEIVLPDDDAQGAPG